jgi:hypothetical protein
VKQPARGRICSGEACKQLKWLHFIAVLTVSSSWSAGASGAEVDLSLSCPLWSAETRAQVEARIRARLLAEPSEAQGIQVSCVGQEIEVVVEAPQQAIRRAVVRQGVVEDDVVQTVDATLGELARAIAPNTNSTLTSPPAPPAEPAPPPAPAAAPLASPSVARAKPVSAPLPYAAKPNIVELNARAAAERWSEHLAWGGDATLLVGTRYLAYGLSLGGRFATGEVSSFQAYEWHARAALRWSPTKMAGFVGSFGVGASLLVVVPAPRVRAESSTMVSAGFAELGLSRPFWFGQFGLGPLVGARVFTAQRFASVNSHDLLSVPLFVPQLALVLTFEPGRRD